MEQTKIVLFGGVFDPIHNGHIQVAKRVLETIQPSLLFLLPAGSPPHKTARRITDAKHRIAMTRLAANSLGPRCVVSDFEAKKNDVCYTIDTLRTFSALYPHAALYYVIGADNIHEISTWRCSQEILKTATIIVVTRPGFDLEQAHQIIPGCICIEDEGVPISSSQLRQQLFLENKTGEFLDPAVEQYVREHSLYPTPCMDPDRIEQAVAQQLSDKRMRHTLGVRDTAVALARQYGADERAAALAALLHDAEKEKSLEELLNFCKSYDIIIDHLQQEQTSLLHGIVAAETAYRNFGIEDNAILHAIRYHTTGCAAMPLLTKILYLADCIEPNRQFQGVEYLRKLASENLDQALCVAIGASVSLLLRQNRTIHPDTISAYNDLIKENVCEIKP